MMRAAIASKQNAPGKISDATTTVDSTLITASSSLMRVAEVTPSSEQPTAGLSSAAPVAAMPSA